MRFPIAFALKPNLTLLKHQEEMGHRHKLAQQLSKTSPVKRAGIPHKHVKIRRCIVNLLWANGAQ